MTSAIRLAGAMLVLELLPSLFGYTGRWNGQPPPAPAALPADLAARYRAVGFAELAALPPASPGATEQPLPPAIRALDGTRVALRGYVIPTVYETNGVTQAWQTVHLRLADQRPQVSSVDGAARTTPTVFRAGGTHVDWPRAGLARPPRGADRRAPMGTSAAV